MRKFNLTDFFAVSLQRKLLLPITAIVLVSMLVMGIYWGETQRRNAVADLEARATLITNLMAQNLGVPMWNVDFVFVQAQFDAVMTDPTLFSIAVYEKNTTQPRVIRQREETVVTPIIRRATVNFKQAVDSTPVRLGEVELIYTQKYVREAIVRTYLTIALFMVALVLVLVFGMYYLIGRLVGTPVQQVIQMMHRIAGGEFGMQLTVPARDEIGQLAAASNDMSVALQRFRDIEVRLTERTQELESRSAYLETATGVSQAAASILEYDKLMLQVVELIRERFGFYFVGLFVVDATKDWAILRAGSGTVGQTLVAKGQRVPIGPPSMVSWCILNRRARALQDVAHDPIRQALPELPDTRSEAVFPLLVRGNIIGALSIEDDKLDTFIDETVTVLQTLTDQVAMALDNARLYTETQTMLETERRLISTASREAWGKLAATQLPGFYSDRRGVFVTEAAWRPEMKQAIATETVAPAPDGGAVAIPLRVRNTVIGALRFQRTGQGVAWNEEELGLLRTLVDQLGVALEGARLYQETQQRAAREQLSREITDKMRRATDMETLIQTTVQEVFAAFGTEVFVQLGMTGATVTAERPRA